MGKGTSCNPMLGDKHGLYMMKQSETSNLSSQSEKIGHSQPAENRTGACASVLHGANGKMTTVADPHLDGVNQIQNVVSNNKPVLFGIPSIFSMPVDFNQSVYPSDEVRQGK